MPTVCPFVRTEANRSLLYSSVMLGRVVRELATDSRFGRISITSGTRVREIIGLRDP
jgi:hypothetical protein